MMMMKMTLVLIYENDDDDRRKIERKHRRKIERKHRKTKRKQTVTALLDLMRLCALCVYSITIVDSIIGELREILKERMQNKRREDKLR